MASIIDSWVECKVIYGGRKYTGYVNPRKPPFAVNLAQAETASRLHGEEVPAKLVWCEVMLDNYGFQALACAWVYVDGVTWDMAYEDHKSKKRRKPPPPPPGRTPRRKVPPPPPRRR